MILENPGALWWLLVLPVLLLGLWLVGWTAKKEIAAMFRLDLGSLKTSHVEKYILAGVIMALLVAALALPKLSFSAPRTPQRAGEVVLLVDVSASMAAQEDLASPNRLERAKPILYEIIDSLEDLGEVRISLHGFTRMARSHVPFVGSEDYPYLEASIKKVLGINSTPGEGSSLGWPILDVVGKFSQDEKVKIIILFGDGETFIGLTSGMHDVERGWIEDAVSKATEQGIKVITVGIGEREGARIPLYDTYGSTGEYAKLGEVDYVSYLEEEVLQEIASRTGGKYFFEEDREGLTEYLEQSLAPVPIEITEEVKEYRNIAHWFVLGTLPLWVVFARRHLLS
jgi:Ca-activated chloride channel family protein